MGEGSKIKVKTLNSFRGGHDEFPEYSSCCRGAGHCKGEKGPKGAEPFSALPKTSLSRKPSLTASSPISSPF